MHLHSQHPPTGFLDHEDEIPQEIADFSEALFDAASQGNVPECKNLLDDGADANYISDSISTPLHQAVSSGSIEVVTLLLDNGASPSICDSEGLTPLTMACLRGHLKIVKCFFSRGIVAVDAGLMPPLFAACRGGHVDIVDMLVFDHAIEILTTYDEGMCIHVACEMEHIDILQTILSVGKTMDIRDNSTPDENGTLEKLLSHRNKEHLSPLHISCAKGNTNAVRVLLDCGANMEDVVLDTGRSPAALAALAGSLDVLHVLHGHGADLVSKTAADGNTCLHLACENMSMDVIRMLISLGGDPYALNGAGKTPLMVAQEHGCDVEVLLAWVENEPSPQQQKDHQLLSATEKNDLGLCVQLIQEGANVNYTEDSGSSPLSIASFNRSLAVIHKLLELGGDANLPAGGFTPLQQSCRLGYVDVVEVLLEHEANVDFRTADGDSALHIACEEGNIQIVRLLLDHKADVSVQARNGSTPLHVSCERGYLETVGPLLDAGADIDTRTRGSGYSPLHLACINNHVETVAFLLYHGANVSAGDENWDSALHFACSRGLPEIACTLLSSGASLVAQNKTGCLPMDLAENNGFGGVMRDYVAQWKSSQECHLDDGKGSGAEPDPEDKKEDEYDQARHLLHEVISNPRLDPVHLPVSYIEQHILYDKKLGEGAYGTVYAGKDDLIDQRFAIKKMLLSSHDEEAISLVKTSFQREIATLKRFRHPNIVTLYAYNLTVGLSQQFLVYELAELGSLDGFLKDDGNRARLAAEKRLSIMFQVTRALHFLHTGGCDGFQILHRDLKSGNICLMADFTAKLIDCGMSKLVQDDCTSTMHSVTPSVLKSSGAKVFGTAGYICPVYNGGHCAFSAACDVYSLGVTFAELIIGCLHRHQSSRGGVTFDDVSYRYVQNERDGWALLLKDADPNIIWRHDELAELCKMATVCMSSGRSRRLKTSVLVERLNAVIRLNSNEGAEVCDFEIAGTEDIPGMCTNGSPAFLDTIAESGESKRCSLCNRRDSSLFGCSKSPRRHHLFCGACLRDIVYREMGSGQQLLCPLNRCGGFISDLDLSIVLSKAMYDCYRDERQKQETLLSHFTTQLRGMLDGFHETQLEHWHKQFEQQKHADAETRAELTEQLSQDREARERGQQDIHMELKACKELQQKSIGLNMERHIQLRDQIRDEFQGGRDHEVYVHDVTRRVISRSILASHQEQQTTLAAIHELSKENRDISSATRDGIEQNNTLIVHQGERSRQRQEWYRQHHLKLQEGLERSLQYTLRLHQQIESMSVGINRSTAALALLTSQHFHRCPNLIWISPTPQKSGKRWKPRQFLKNIVKKTFTVCFVCHHSFQPGHAPFEINVPRPWLSKVAPILKLSLFVLKCAGTVSGLPFPIQDTGWFEQLELMTEFVDLLVEPEDKEKVDHCESMLFMGRDDATIAWNQEEIRDTVGPSFDAIADKANKRENSNWKLTMCPVLDEQGATRWVSVKHKHHYAV